MKDSGNTVLATEDTYAPYATADINMNMPQCLEPTFKRTNLQTYYYGMVIFIQSFYLV